MNEADSSVKAFSGNGLHYIVFRKNIELEREIDAPKITKDETISVRLQKQDRKKIEQLVNKGLFKNKSEFIRQAIKKQLKQSSSDIHTNPNFFQKFIQAFSRSSKLTNKTSHTVTNLLTNKRPLKR